MNLIKKQLRLLPKVIKPKKVSSVSLYFKEFYQNFEGNPQEKLSKMMKEFSSHKKEFDQKAADHNASNPIKQLSTYDQLILSRREYLQDRLKGKKSTSKLPLQRNMSAYTMYMKKMLNLSDGEFVARFGNEAGTVTEKFKALGTMWKSLDASEKKKYEELAQADKERYEKDLREFEEKDEVKKANQDIKEALFKAKESLKPKKKKVIKAKKVKAKKAPKKKIIVKKSAAKKKPAVKGKKTVSKKK